MKKEEHLWRIGRYYPRWLKERTEIKEKDKELEIRESALFSFEGASLQKRRENPVTIARRNHPFPYRTRKLSSLTSMVLGG